MRSPNVTWYPAISVPPAEKLANIAIFEDRNWKFELFFQPTAGIVDDMIWQKRTDLDTHVISWYRGELESERPQHTTLLPPLVLPIPHPVEPGEQPIEDHCTICRTLTRIEHLTARIIKDVRSLEKEAILICEPCWNIRPTYIVEEV